MHQDCQEIQHLAICYCLEVQTSGDEQTSVKGHAVRGVMYPCAPKDVIMTYCPESRSSHVAVLLSWRFFSMPILPTVYCKVDERLFDVCLNMCLNSTSLHSYRPTSIN